MKPFFCMLLCIFTVKMSRAASPADVTDAPVAESANSLIFTTAMDIPASGRDRANGALDWIHDSTSGSTYTLGLSVFSTDTSRWIFGRGGAALRPTERMTVQAEASIGGGSTTGNRFAYQIYNGSLTYKMAQRVYGRLGEEFFQIADTHGHLLKPGVVIVANRYVQSDTTYAHTLSGNIATQFVSERLDFTSRVFNLFGGYSFGHSSPQRLNLEIGSQPNREEFRDAFIGLGLHLSSTVISVVSDFLTVEADHRRSLTMSWRVPLRRAKKERR